MRSRYSPSILSWPQSGQASSAARSSQWRYTHKKSCPVVRRKRATSSALSRCFGNWNPVARVSRGLVRLLGFWVNACGNKALCSSESHDTSG
ncbi:hypothetical protein TNCV_2837551 [Trichonephila clavipes]|nr:hypothetical protein TNCV_2837551 [Trichonephila clavipes]